VAWTDETIVVDSNSSDDTAGICRELGASLHQTSDWPGFGPQKNRALDLATGEWVISLDADEWAPPELRAEIERLIAAPGDKVAFAFPLFRRNAARFSDDNTHERLIVKGATGRLKQPLMHQAIDDLDQMIAKMNTYSTNTARMLHERGRRASIFTALLHGGWTFVRTYVLRLGFLDGREGFMLAVANAEGSYYRYIKLMLLSEDRVSREP